VAVPSMIPRTLLIALLALLAALAGAVTAQAPSAPTGTHARASIKKAIWAESGAAFAGGRNEFPVYRDLGVGIVQTNIDWNEVVRRRPRNASDPNDPAYRWDPRVDRTVQEARRFGIRVALLIGRSPPYANRGRSSTHAPDPAEFARFARAAARRYSTVRLWLVWGEPTRAFQFRPRISEAGTARRYARLLDAAYVALKGVNRRNLVIGGNTYTGGEAGNIHTLTWVRNLRLTRRPPRMDMYGHNPFSYRQPNLRKPLSCCGQIDLSDLDVLAAEVDRYLGRGKKLFLSELTIPTSRGDGEFPFYVDPPVQADWITRALRITRTWSRIYTLGWIHLRDEDSPRRITSGLIDSRGNFKPGYFAFRAG
jgi:hypothetical protein